MKKETHIHSTKESKLEKNNKNILRSEMRDGPSERVELIEVLVNIETWLYKISKWKRK